MASDNFVEPWWLKSPDQMPYPWRKYEIIINNYLKNTREHKLPNVLPKHDQWLIAVLASILGLSETKADVDSPNLTGTPTTPTPTDDAEGTQIANVEYVKKAIEDLIGGAGEALDTLKELADALNNDANFGTKVIKCLEDRYTKEEVDNILTLLMESVQADLDTKVDKEDGKGLSTNDFTDELKAKLEAIEDNANNYELPAATEETLGGVIVGDNLTVDEDGLLSITKENVTDALGYTPPEQDTTYGEATAEEHGLMSAEDKAKLDALPDNEDLQDALDNKANAEHTQATDTIDALTGYSLDDTEAGQALAASDTLNEALAKIEATLNSKQDSGDYAAAEHTHSTDEIVTLTGYEKAEEAAALDPTDTLNEALGKLEAAIDTKVDLGDYTTHSSKDIVSMEGYEICAEVDQAILVTDTLNVAIGKLEATLKTKASADGSVANAETADYATEAEKATNDASGNPITSYVKSINFTEGSTSVTVTKGDGTTELYNTKDTTYSTGTSSVAGITKLYGTTGENTDGAMTQAAVTDNLKNYLPLAGGTLTGKLILASDPASDLQAATKKYVDDKILEAETGDHHATVSWSDITDKPDTFTPSEHAHTTKDITDFPELAEVATSGSYKDLTDTPTSMEASGGDADTVAGHTVAVDVPADAVFTDTTYDVFTGATSSADGTQGLVPAPSAGDEAKFLTGAGTWSSSLDASSYVASVSAESDKLTVTKGNGTTEEVDITVSKVGTSTVGSNVKPVYINNGAPTACELYTASTEDIEADSNLETGKLYLVYEE